jgi:hypothetical protein
VLRGGNLLPRACHDPGDCDLANEVDEFILLSCMSIA